MKKFLTVMTLIVVVGVGGVFSIPLLIDDAGLKQKFIENLQAITGRNVSVDGKFSLKFTPSPTISVENTRLENITGATKPDMLEIEKITAQLDLKSFITGNIKISKAELIKPFIYLETLPNGQVNWMLDFLKARDPFDVNNSKLSNDVSFDSLTIQDGTIVFVNKNSNVEYKLENLNGEMIAETLRGPYRFDGTFKLFESSTGLAISLDKLNDREPSELNIMLSRPDTGASIAFSGSLSNTMQSFSLNGNMIADIENPDKFIAFWFPNFSIPDTLQKPIAANLSIKINGNKVSLNDIVIKQGENSAVGNASFSLYQPENDKQKNLNANLIISYFDISPMTDLIQKINKNNLKFIDNALLNLKADVLKYQNGKIEDLSLTVDSSTNTLNFNNIKAKLPGNSSLQGNLSLTNNNTEKNLNLAGNISLETKKTSQIFNWLKLPIPSDILNLIPIENATFNTEIYASPNSFYLNKIVANAENINIEGNIGTNLASEQNNLDLNLQISGVDIKNFLEKIHFKEKFKKFSQENPNLAMLEILEPLDLLKNYNASIKIDLAQATYGQISSPRITFNANIQNDIITINEFRMNNINGNSLNLKGEISTFNQNNQVKFKNLETSLKLSRVNQILNDMEINIPFDTKNINNLLLDATLNGSMDNLLFKLVGDTSGTYFNVEGSYLENNKENEPQTTFSLEVRHPQIRNFFHLFSSYNLPAGLLGNFKFIANIDKTPKQTKITDLELNIGNDKITGNAGLAKTNEDIFFVASLETDTLLLDQYLSSKQTVYPDSTYPITYDWTKEPIISSDYLKNLTAQITFSANNMALGNLNLDNAIFKIKIANKILELTSLNALVGEEGKMNMKGVMDFRTDIPAFAAEASAEKIKINKIFNNIDTFNVSANSADLSARIAGKGKTIYDILSSLTGTGNLSFIDGELIGFSLTSAYDFIKETFTLENPQTTTFIPSFRQALQNKQTPFNKLSGSFNIKNGELITNPLDLTYNENKQALIAFKLNLNTSQFNTAIKVLEDKQLNIPSYAMNLKGNLDSPSYSFSDTELANQLINKVKDRENQIKKDAIEKAKLEETQKIQQKQKFETELEKLKKEVGDAYQKVLNTEKMAKLTETLQSLANENRSLGEKILLDFSPLVEIASKNSITDNDINQIQQIATKVQKPISKINENYSKAVVVSAKYTAKQYAQDAAKFVKYARDMEKANPFAPVISDAAKKIDDAGYEAEISSKLAEEATSEKQAEEAVIRAKKAFDIAKEEVARIVKFTGSTEGLE